jgi:uridine kinase
MGTPLRLGKSEVAIFEGIHALNDDCAGRFPQAACLYISARSDVLDGEDLIFKRTWMRLCRRSVRDYNFRGTSVPETMDMWANVRRGEKLYISPFKGRAHYKFDSSLAYEVSVMRYYAEPLMEAVPPENIRRPELLELCKAFDHFTPIDPALVHPNSLLREFIGGGSYDYD